MIAARDLGLRAGTRTLLAGASFEFLRGEFIAVLGPNGAGKTTLLRTLAGVRAPDAGAVAIEGSDVRWLGAAQRARRVAHIASDEVFVDHLTVRDVVTMGRYAHHRWWEWGTHARDDAAVDRALEAVRMQSFAGRPFATLSSGERQRIWLALALSQEAPLLLLDEPTSHLDLRVAQDILHLLRLQADAGKAVVCVLHDINEAAQFADRIVLLGGEGVLGIGPPGDVLTPALIERAYGIPVERARTASGTLRIFPAAASSASEPTAR